MKSALKLLSKDALSSDFRTFYTKHDVQYVSERQPTWSAGEVQISHDKESPTPQRIVLKN